MRRDGWMRGWVMSTVVLCGVALVVGGGCREAGPKGESPPPELAKADVVTGGALYDRYWVVARVEAPKEDHPLWATRPDKESNKRTGAETWRCKECHGWDYKGVDGVYKSGSHRTGFPGFLGTKRPAGEIFALLKNPSGPDAKAGHGYGGVLSDADIWNVTKFVVEGQIDTATIIGADGKFTGDVEQGKKLFTAGLGKLVGCAACHGEDGLSVPKGAPKNFSAWVGLMTNENPWEAQHKVRFGQPGTMMVGWYKGMSTKELADVGAFAQTLPKGPKQEEKKK